jgi:AcrR family transcriptional regulator
MSTSLDGVREAGGSRSRRTRAALVRSTHAYLARTSELQPEEVAKEAGVSTATFYAHFASKDEAIAAALDVALGEVSRQGRAPLTIEHLLDHGLEETVRAAVTAGIEAFREHHRVFRLALSRLPHARSIREVYRHHEREMADELRRFLQLSMAAHQVRVGDLDAMTATLLVFLQGLNNPLLRGRDDPAVLDELTRQVTGWLTPEAT